MTENSALAGRVALITGGGGEIGGAIAQRFAAAGAAIMIADIRRDQAEAMAAAISSKGGQAAAVRANVAVAEDAEKSVRHAVERFGKLTTLVNVAANVTPDGTVETLTLEDWNDALAVNLTGAFLMCKYGVPEIRKAGGGTIINIASQLGQIGVAGRAPYTTSKAALIQFTKCLAADHAADGIRARTRGRDRRRRAVSGVARIVLHDRRRPFARWRLSCLQGHNRQASLGNTDNANAISIDIPFRRGGARGSHGSDARAIGS